MPDLSDSVLWSEIDSNNNATSPNGWPEGMMPSGVNDSARADRGALKRFWARVNPVQTITPSGGVYTFSTANPAYPTKYIDGEIYGFRAGADSAGGDQFQVNTLASKPIWKRIDSGTGFTPIIHQDILAALALQLIYDSSLNAGVGAFVLLNPFVPISGDGAGGVSVPGGLAVGGDLTMAGSVAATGGMSITGDLGVTGRVNATGYSSRSGVGGPYQTNLFNIQWTGADGAHLWIDTTDQGPIICATGGNIVVGGSISAGGITTSGEIHAAGSIQTTSTGGGFGGVSIYATAGGIRSDVTGTAFYAPNGNVVCQGISTNGGINVGGFMVSNGLQTTTLHATSNAFIEGNLTVNGNVAIGGTLNGHPAMALADLMTQLNELSIRVTLLEER